MGDDQFNNGMARGPKEVPRNAPGNEGDSGGRASRMARRLRAGVRAEDLASIDANKKMIPKDIRDATASLGSPHADPIKIRAGLITVGSEVAGSMAELKDGWRGRSLDDSPDGNERTGKVISIRRSGGPDFAMARLGRALRDARDKIMNFDIDAIDAIVACQVGTQGGVRKLNGQDGGQGGGELKFIRPAKSGGWRTHDEKIEKKSNVVPLKPI